MNKSFAILYFILAAAQELSQAQERYAKYLLAVIGVERNQDIGIEYLHRGAVQGLISAQFLLVT
jgi:TPR repeat protein